MTTVLKLSKSASAVSRNLLCNGKEKRKATVGTRDIREFAIALRELIPN